MRWKLALAALAVLLVADATTATAQVPPDGHIPVTMTMEADEHPDSLKAFRPPASNNPIDSVLFINPATGETLSWIHPVTRITHAAVTKPDTLPTQQTLVGYLGPSQNADGSFVYRLQARVFIAHSIHWSEFWFGPEDHCTPSGEGNIERIACALEKRGKDLVCTAIYEGMNDPLPLCGSHACVTCRRVQVCGADPECP